MYVCIYIYDHRDHIVVHIQQMMVKKDREVGIHSLSLACPFAINQKLLQPWRQSASCPFSASTLLWFVYTLAMIQGLVSYLVDSGCQ